MPLAPAKPQKWSSSLASNSALARLGGSPSNTQWLRRFDNVQAPKMMMKLKPFIKWSGTLLELLSHQSSKEISSDRGVRLCKPTQRRRKNQNSRAKTHVGSKWLIFSSSWSQRGQQEGWGSPLRVNRSAIQHLSWTTSHMKKRHFPGAKFSNPLERTEKYRTKKQAFIGGFCWVMPITREPPNVSSTSGCSTTSEMWSHRAKYSEKKSADKAPWISLTQVRSVKASSSVLSFLFLLGTDAKTWGARSAMPWP